MNYIEFKATITGHHPLDQVQQAAFQGSNGGTFEAYSAQYDMEGIPPKPVTIVQLNCSTNEAPAVLGSLARAFPPPTRVRSSERAV